MRTSAKFKVMQVKETMQKVHKEARKLALAVVIMQFMIAGAWLVAEKVGIIECFEPKTMVIHIVSGSEVPVEQPKTAQNKEMEQLKDYIWFKESTRGKNNYSKCEAIGEVNGIGYGIPGNGKYMCFEDHAEEMKVLETWIKNKQAQGMTNKGLLCLYNRGIVSETCNYIKDMR